MDARARESYLESQILTATPQKLRLMLIEAAIGAARQTLELWQQEQPERAADALIRCRNIVSELLAGIRPDNSELSRRVMGIYVFLFKALTEAQLRRDQERLREAIGILEFERDTWREVCEKMPHALAAAENAESEVREITSTEAGRLLSAIRDPQAGGEVPPNGGLVLDA